KQLRVGREREFVDDEPRVIVERIEALQEEREQRADIDDADPQQRRQQEQQCQKLGARYEQIRYPVEAPLPRVGWHRRPTGYHRLAHFPSSMVTMAVFGQMSLTLPPSLNEDPAAGTSAAIRKFPVSTLKRVTAP